MYHKICKLKQTIDNKQELWHYLRIAMEIELSTIPTYLSALYSIKPGTNQQAYRVIQSVLIEEMLHLTLAGNVLNSVGGPNPLSEGCPPMEGPAVVVNKDEFVPNYPTPLPASHIVDWDGDIFEVPLQRFGKPAIEAFLRIELPDAGSAPPEVEGWQTIGQFYDGLKKGINDLVEKFGAEAVFDGDPQLQITESDYYGGAGAVVVIDHENAQRRHEQALEALDVIVEQGEGVNQGVFEEGHIPCQRACDWDDEIPAHYFRFQEVQLGQFYQPGDVPYKPEDRCSTGPTGEKFDVDWDNVYPMRTNPKMQDYEPGSPIFNKLLEFNLTYVKLLDELQEVFNTSHSYGGDQHERMLKAVGVMYELKYKAIALMKIPSGLGDGTTVGPSFQSLAQIKDLVELEVVVETE